MGRLVSAKPKTTGLVADVATEGKKADNNVKDYFERLVKYVPSEILAAFTAINGFLSNSPGNIKYWGLMINLLICAIFTPIYFGLIADKDDPADAKRKQKILSFIAFWVWAYSITGEGGIFGKTGWNIYYSGISSSLIVLFSLISGAIIPRKDS